MMMKHDENSIPYVNSIIIPDKRNKNPTGNRRGKGETRVSYIKIKRD
jgi:hypothetical protein